MIATQILLQTVGQASDRTPLLTEPRIFWACIVVGVIGILVMGVLAGFGFYLFRPKPRAAWLEWSLNKDVLEFLKSSNVRPNIPWHVLRSYAEYLQRMNDFWAIYVQVLTAVLLIVLLSILLLTRTISAEAGLPILSAISGFAIAKGSSAARASGSSEPDTSKTTG